MNFLLSLITSVSLLLGSPTSPAYVPPPEPAFSSGTYSFSVNAEEKTVTIIKPDGSMEERSLVQTDSNGASPVPGENPSAEQPLTVEPVKVMTGTVGHLSVTTETGNDLIMTYDSENPIQSCTVTICYVVEPVYEFIIPAVGTGEVQIIPNVR